MIKKILSSIVVLAAILFSVNIVNAASGRADIRLNSTAVKPGDSFTLTIAANCPEGINGIQTTYSYDSNKLELVSDQVASNKFADMGGGQNGKVEVITNTTDKLTSENIYALTFKVKDNAQVGDVATISTGDIVVSSDDGSKLTETAKTANINIATTTQNSTSGNTGSNNNGTTNNGNANTNNNTNNGTNSGLSSVIGTNGNSANGNSNTANNSTTGTQNNTTNQTNSLANKILPKTGEARNKVVLIIFIAIAAGCSLIFYIKTNKIKKMYR